MTKKNSITRKLCTYHDRHFRKIKKNQAPPLLSSKIIKSYVQLEKNQKRRSHFEPTLEKIKVKNRNSLQSLLDKKE